MLMAAAFAPGAANAAPASRAVKPLACPSAGTRAVALAKVTDGSTFVTSEGTEVRLAGVLAPGEGGESLSSSQADGARGALARALGTGPLTLGLDDGARDRYGRVLAQVFANGTWVQAAMLRAGEFRVAPDRVSAPCALLLLSAEGDARARRAGHWRDLFFLRTPEEIGNRAGTFQIVEGTVVSASLYRGRAYINFGADYRSDFTVTVAPADMRAFRQARFDVKTLTGQRIRVRGWVELYNGPEMQIATPAAIEALD